VGPRRKSALNVAAAKTTAFEFMELVVGDMGGRDGTNDKNITDIVGQTGQIEFMELLDSLVYPELLRAFSFAVEGEFKSLVIRLAIKVGLFEKDVSTAPGKGVARIRVKREQYKELLHASPCSSSVTDTLRTSIICEKSSQMSMVWNEMANEGQLTVMRLKNKASEGIAPYNLHVNALFQPSSSLHPIIVEIQIHDAGVYDKKKINHHMYEVIRAPRAAELH